MNLKEYHFFLDNKVGRFLFVAGTFIILTPLCGFALIIYLVYRADKREKLIK